MTKTISAEQIKIKSVLNLIGNVDHSQGNGENSALMRGQLLNDIRTILSSDEINSVTVNG